MTVPEFSAATEREALCGFLDLQRAVLVRKAQGVSDADARQAPTASSLSLLGLLKHSALWERRWFQFFVAGRLQPGEWPQTEIDEDELDAEDFRVGEQDTIEHWVARYAGQAAISRQITAERDLDSPCAWAPLAHLNLRWVLLHMIEETARHAGHADIIRETIDGSRGL
ncbi:MAG TPA: DinB family protein [Streptosporangiaceae bacterium]|nr:DinB family protein [Streptosporangiaceae bacterium]